MRGRATDQEADVEVSKEETFAVLALTGAQEMLMYVSMFDFDCPVQVCLQLSIVNNSAVSQLYLSFI